MIGVNLNERNKIDNLVHDINKIALLEDKERNIILDQLKILLEKLKQRIYLKGKFELKKFNVKTTNKKVSNKSLMPQQKNMKIQGFKKPNNGKKPFIKNNNNPKP